VSTIQNSLSVIAGFLALAGFLPYIIAIFRDKARPAKVSWVTWATLSTITLLAMYAKDALNGQIIGAVLGDWVVVVLAIKYGKPGWTRLDVFCLVGAVVGIALWQAFSNPILAILASQCATCIGSIPTFVSAWHDPSKEDRTAWTIFWLSCVAAVMAIPSWTLQDAAQPISFFANMTVMMYLLYLRPRPSKLLEKRELASTNNE